MKINSTVRVLVTVNATWWPQGTVTGIVQHVYKNGKVAVAVHQLPNGNPRFVGGDGLTTLHFHARDLEVIA